MSRLISRATRPEASVPSEDDATGCIRYGVAYGRSRPSVSGVDPKTVRFLSGEVRTHDTDIETLGEVRQHG